MVSSAVAIFGGIAPARAETVTDFGSLSILPGRTSMIYNQSPIVLPFTVTAPCESTDYGYGYISTSCHAVYVDLVHPSTPVSVDSALLFPEDDGTGSGSLSVYGFMLQGFGDHTLRATDSETGRTTAAVVNIKALTRTQASFIRSKKAPAQATLRITASLTYFDGYSFPKMSLKNPLVLQRNVGRTWVRMSTAYTTGGSASWSFKVRSKATYRVCHTADRQSTASCTSNLTT
ncbi:MAG: hypothetical protein QG608_2660 [Actinomycetota bacterium]|nr:hypothetical protein [Actinomycetota bacterium]